MPEIFRPLEAGTSSTWDPSRPDLAGTPLAV